MLISEKDILLAAMALDKATRVQLIKQLTDSLLEQEETTSPAWRSEIHDRIQAFETGEISVADCAEVMAGLG